MQDAIKRPFAMRCMVSICLGWVLTPYAFAQQPLSIDDTVSYALSHGSEHSQSRASIAAKQEFLLAEQRKSWPSLAAELTVLRGSGKPTSFSAVNLQQDLDTPTLDSIKGNYGVGTFKLSTPLFHDGSFFFQQTPTEVVAEGKYNKAQSDSNTQAAVLANDVAKAYLNALSTADQLKLLTSAYEKNQQRLDAVHKRVQAGLANQADELSVKATVAEQLATLNATKRLHVYQRMLLAYALDANSEAEITLLPIASEFPNAPQPDQLTKVIADTHTAVMSQTANLKIAKSTLASQRAEHLPEVTFDITRTEAGDLFTDSTNKFVSAGINLRVTLMDSGQTRAKSRARNYEVEENREILTQTRTKVIQDIYQAYYTYQNAVDTYTASIATVEKTRAQEQESIAKRNKGLISLDTLLEDETESLESKVQQINKQYEAWLSWADFIKSLGLTYRSSLNSIAR